MRESRTDSSRHCTQKWGKKESAEPNALHSWAPKAKAAGVHNFMMQEGTTPVAGQSHGSPRWAPPVEPSATYLPTYLPTDQPTDRPTDRPAPYVPREHRTASASSSRSKGASLPVVWLTATKICF